MPWSAIDRLQSTYGVEKRELETLLSLDEYDAAGLAYFEQVTGGDAKMGNRAINLYVFTGSDAF